MEQSHVPASRDLYMVLYWRRHLPNSKPPIEEPSPVSLFGTCNQLPLKLLSEQSAVSPSLGLLGRISTVGRGLTYIHTYIHVRSNISDVFSAGRSNLFIQYSIDSTFGKNKNPAGNIYNMKKRWPAGTGLDPWRLRVAIFRWRSASTCTR